MTLNKKSLSIMNTTANHKKQNEYYYYEDDSLISPPLTPTDTQCPLSMNEVERPVKNRKEFIVSYCKMAPYLKPTSNNKMKMFELNVYDRYLRQQSRNQERRKRTGSHHTNNMLNNVVLPIPKKRKLAIIPTQPTSLAIQDDTIKRKRVSSCLPTGKEAALAFDAIDIDMCDQEFYPFGWVPAISALDNIPVRVSWKGAPLAIDDQPYFNHLHKVEATMASILRLTPVQYLRCKRTLILASRTLKINQIPFTKSIAQKLCRVDVNKTSALWTAFGQLGWFDGPV